MIKTHADPPEQDPSNNLGDRVGARNCAPELSSSTEVFEHFGEERDY